MMRRGVAVSIAFASISSVVVGARARDGGQEPRRGDIVARLAQGPRGGSAPPVTVGELQDRLALMPAFQRAAYGATAAVMRRRVLEDVLLRDRLLEVDARAQHVEGEPAIAFALERAASMATVRAVRSRVGDPGAVSDTEVRAYYDREPQRYEAPARIEVWRILCGSADEARSVLESCRASCTPAVFSALARDHSLDKATYLRGGDLGFLAADGTSSYREVRVAPTLFQAASAVRDGDLVASPVAEGDRFAVVWRRGTVPAVHRSLAQVAPSIREAIADERVRDEVQRLLAERRASEVRDLDETPVETLDVGIRP